MTRNKNRIYLALYARTGPQSHIHHISLLVSPKKPDPNGNNTWRFHVMNIPNPAYVTMQEWQYQALLVLGRTTRLIALVLLGKTVKSGEEIGQILTAVDIVQDNPSWTCKEWVFSAIEVSQLSHLIYANQPNCAIISASHYPEHR